MAAHPPIARAHSLLTISASAAVPNVAQLGGQVDPLRLGDVVLLYAQDKNSYLFSDVSRYVGTVGYIRVERGNLKHGVQRNAAQMSWQPSIHKPGGYKIGGIKYTVTPVCGNPLHITIYAEIQCATK